MPDDANDNAVSAELARQLLSNNPEAWLAAIVDSSDDAIVGKTLDTIIRSWNAGATRIFGYAPEEIIGKSVYLLIPPDRHDEEPAIISRLSGGNRIDHFETVRLRKDGTPIEVSISVSPIRDKSGRIIGAAKIARDISEAKRLLQAERELTEQLQGLANELAGYVDLMEMEIRGSLTPQQRQDLARIKRSQQTLLRLIQDVLNFAKLESGRLEFRYEDVDLNDFLALLQQFVAPRLAQKKLSYRFEACEPGTVVQLDRDKVEQIMLNLLSNAVKFTDEGEIAVKCILDASRVAIQVRDTGRGVHPRAAARLSDHSRISCTARTMESAPIP